MMGDALDVEAGAAFFRLLDPVGTEVTDVDKSLFLASSMVLMFPPLSLSASFEARLLR